MDDVALSVEQGDEIGVGEEPFDRLELEVQRHGKLTNGVNRRDGKRPALRAELMLNERLPQLLGLVRRGVEREENEADLVGIRAERALDSLHVADDARTGELARGEAHRDEARPAAQ